MAVPYMPLYVADYMADTAHLTTLEHGAYLMLIMSYWQRGEALPNDDKKLARIARLGPREWARIKPSMAEFFELSASSWFHRRLDRELTSLRDKSLKKRKGGLARAKQMHSTCSQDAKLIQISDTSSVSKDTGASADSDKVFWATAVGYVGNRALVGKWCRDHGKTETAKAITAAQLERPVDPVAYIVGALRKAKANGQEMPVC